MSRSLQASYENGRLTGSRPGRRPHRPPSRSAPSPTWGSGLTRNSSSSPSSKWSTTTEREVFRGCTRGCRFCQAGMITRPSANGRRPRSAGWSVTASIAPATTKSPSLAVERRLLGHRRHGDVDHQRPGLLRPGVGQPPQPPGGCFHRRSGRRDQKVRRTGLTFAPKEAPGACARSSTSSSGKRISIRPWILPSPRVGSG